MNHPKRGRLVEVGPRDGLQNEAKPVPVAAKVALIDALSAAGHAAVEAGSFVSPKWVPQMANTDEVMSLITRKPGVAYPVLVPNKQGMNGAIEAHCEEIAIFTAASEAFCRRNTNCSIDESFARFEPVMEAAQKHAGLRTDYLFRLANQQGGLVVGTGDLSELGLGWCTYGVGDHMSHYNPNASVAKTLIQHLIRFVVHSAAIERGDDPVLDEILATQIS